MSYAQPQQTASSTRALLSGSAVLGGALAVSAAATQFVAWRVHYHPALGAPLLGHFYAPWSWVEWMRAPWAEQVSRTFQIMKAGLAVGGVAVVGLVVLLKGNRRRHPIKYEGIQGTAHFMDERGIRSSGLLAQTGGLFRGNAWSNNGVYVGGWQDKHGAVHYLRHDGPEHCIVIAPTRSGKGVGNILPTLLSWPASSIVYDEKGELWALTAGWRSKQAGNTVIRWAPGDPENGAGFNFLEEVRLGTEYEVADAQNITQMLCDPNGEGMEGKDYWSKASFDILSAVTLHVLYKARAEGKTAGLADVAFMLADPEEKADHLWKDMLENTWFDGKRHMVIAAGGRDMLDRPDKERSGVLSSAKSFLGIFRDPIVARNTSRSSFRIMDLMNHDKPVSLYIVTRGADKERLRPLVRLVLTMAMRTLTGVELNYDKGQAVMPHKHRMLMMLDEFPSLGRLQIIQDSLPKVAGYGIKMFLAAQNREQMFNAYGQWQSITGNCHVRIIYAPNEIESARWISDIVGQTTIVKEDVTESGTRYGRLKNVSRTYHEVQRAVMTPDEIMRLRKPMKNAHGEIVSSGEMVVFMAGEPPIRGTQILYFLDGTFIKRSQVPAPDSGTTMTVRPEFPV